MAEIVVNKLLQELSNPFTDGLMLFFSFFGSEGFFIAAALAVFWCADKREGYKIINVYCFSVAVTHGLKNLIKRQRPYDYDGIKSIGEQTVGYSFPSGHSQSAANLAFQLSDFFRKKYIIVISSVIVFLVMLSRVYLGQHFVTDVFAGAALGIAAAFLFGRLFELLKNKEELLMFFTVPLCIAALTAGALGGGSSPDTLKLTGGFIAVALGYYIEKKFVRLNVTASAAKQAIKLVIGFGVILLLKEGLKAVIPQDLDFLYCFVRYFTVGFTAVAGLPLLFRALKLYGTNGKKQATV